MGGPLGHRGSRRPNPQWRSHFRYSFVFLYIPALFGTPAAQQAGTPPSVGRMDMRPYSAAVAGIRPSHPRGGMQNLTVGNANGPPPEGSLRSRPSATEGSWPQGGSKAPREKPTLRVEPRRRSRATFQGWGRAEGPVPVGRCPTRRSAALSGPGRCETVTWAYYDADFGHESTRLANVNIVLVFVYVVVGPTPSLRSGQALGPALAGASPGPTLGMLVSCNRSSFIKPQTSQGFGSRAAKRRNTLAGDLEMAPVKRV